MDIRNPSVYGQLQFGQFTDSLRTVYGQLRTVTVLHALASRWMPLNLYCLNLDYLHVVRLVVWRFIAASSRQFYYIIHTNVYYYYDPKGLIRPHCAKVLRHILVLDSVYIISLVFSIKLLMMDVFTLSDFRN